MLMLEKVTETNAMEALNSIIETASVENTIKSTNEFFEKIKSYTPFLISLVIKLAVLVIIWFVGSRLIKFVLRIIKKGLKKRKVEITVSHFLISLLKVILYFILIFEMAEYLNFPATSILAVVGSAGIAVGLALQGSLSNFAGGILILVLKPFKIGDYIIEDTHGNCGTVKKIDLFYTELSTADNRIIIIPNGTLANSSLTNTTLMEKRRIDIKVNISYQANLKQVKSILSDILEKHSDILQNEERLVFVRELGDSAVVIQCSCWVKTDMYLKTLWDLNEKIKISLDENNIEIPYNQLDVHIKS